MNNPALRDVVIKELGLDGLPEEAQDEIVSKLGEVIMKAQIVAIYENLSQQAREEFERISAGGDAQRIQEFLEINIPNYPSLMEEEVKKILHGFKEG